MNNSIFVVDLGGQYAHLIARRVRELGVYSEIVKPDAPTAKMKEAKGIILSGSPASICSESIKFNKEIYDLNIPILGFCYGHQMFARDLGGSVSKQDTKEFGLAELSINNKKLIFDGLKSKEIVWMSHHDKVDLLPHGFEVIATTKDCDTAGIANFKRNFYGFQFHPEVTHTKNGMTMISNFLFKVCKVKKNWDIDTYLESLIKDIKLKVKDKKVFILVSGGVDSIVALALINKAIGKENIYALHVDTGFMRLNEASEVKKALKKLGLSDFHVVDASDKFLKALKGVIEPEEKRKIIGNLFLEVKDEESSKINLNSSEWILGQGTIYPDTIESGGTDHADTIKTHHNRVDLIQKLLNEGKVIEPLDKLYKDEVRVLGQKLGLPDVLVWRHPFPGPGLAIRALCSDGKDKEAVTFYDNIIVKAKKIISQLNLKEKIDIHVLPIKSVGVQGDLRTYRNTVVISGKIDFNKLEKISTLLTNGLSEINRVIYQVDSMNLSGLKLIKADLNKGRLDLLRKIDHFVMQKIEKEDINKDIWQFPTILLPVGSDNRESIVLRPIQSIEAMTVNFYKMKSSVLADIKNEILAIKNISHLFYDITNKPPATIEWE